MNEIYKNVTNTFLPSIVIQNILLKEDKITVTYKAEPADGNQISNFTSDDYFKYLEVFINCGGDSYVTDTLSGLPATRIVTLPYENPINLVLNFDLGFNLASIKKDLNITDEQFSVIGRLNFLTTRNQISYPITDINTEVVDPVIDNGSEVPTIVTDYRKIADLNKIELKKPYLTPTGHETYFTSLGSSTYGKRLSTFIQFDFKNYLKYNSFFSDDNYDNFSLLLTISDNVQIIDKIKISRTNGKNIIFKSDNEKSILIKSNSDKVIFYFYEDFSYNNSVDKSYNVKIDYVDTTFLNFYNQQQNTGFFLDTNNKVNILKNNINIAKKFSDYEENFNKINPLYLLLNNDRFTNQFNNFYNSQTINYKTSFNIDITTNSIIDDVMAVINKFAKDKINDKDINQIKNDLSINENTNCTYSTYVSFLLSVDTIFSLIQKTISNSTLTKKQYVKVLPKIKTEIKDQYYIFDDLKFNNSIPTFSLSLFNDIIASSKRKDVTPKYFYNFGNLIIIDDNLDYGTDLYNSVLNYTSNLKTKTYPYSNQSLLFGEEILSQYSVSYHTALQKVDIIPKQSSTKPSQFSSELPQRKFLQTDKRLKLNDIKNLDSDVIDTIKQDNKLIHSLTLGKTFNKPEKTSIAPILQFFYYEEKDNNWKPINSSTELSGGVFVKVNQYVSNESILGASKIEKEKIHLDSNYFVLGKS